MSVESGFKKRPLAMWLNQGLGKYDQDGLYIAVASVLGVCLQSKAADSVERYPLIM